MAELTSADYAYLIILKAADRELSNTELSRLYGVRLVSPDYERLNAAGYVSSDTKRRPYRHTITSDGKKAVLVSLTVDQGKPVDGEKRSAGERQLFWAALIASQQLLERLARDRPAAAAGNGVAAEAGHEGMAESVEPADLAGRIRAAYSQLAGSPGEWIDLTALRPLLQDVSKAELDRALAGLLDAGDVLLEPEAFMHRVGESERRAAVHIGGEDRHKLAIGRR
ncbi:hypothetical protein Acy02nite_86020 [Actinoplanes cyaneus]|uniref:Uncharacterized protein n=1 Tax=Actinoplanes cyaneus TaxID=52696 RepID=A0A919ITG8_9ACTN|nr:hypothetical protein [Actinoplanes cyaneus]MCW2144062.1 hypothetical protein [Actinoplanes cyaneus]GID70721.1 hypothetical protein Acy02nite_86020 [Actinoplanes cyaneus]